MAGEYIDSVYAGDRYTEALTVGPDFQAKKVIVTVEENDAYMQFAMGQLGSWRWTDEREYRAIPQSLSVGRVIGVRFRNALPGVRAKITALLQTDDDPDFGVGLPFGSTGSPALTGQVDAGGAPIAGTGYSCSRIGVGQYEITFSTPYPATPVVVANVLGGGGYVAQVGPTFDMVLVQTFDAAGAAIDVAFNFIAEPMV